MRFIKGARIWRSTLGTQTCRTGAWTGWALSPQSQSCDSGTKPPTRRSHCPVTPSPRLRGCSQDVARGSGKHSGGRGLGSGSGDRRQKTVGGGVGVRAYPKTCGRVPHDRPMVLRRTLSDQCHVPSGFWGLGFGVMLNAAADTWHHQNWVLPGFQVRSVFSHPLVALNRSWDWGPPSFVTPQMVRGIRSLHQRRPLTPTLRTVTHTRRSCHCIDSACSGGVRRTCAGAWGAHRGPDGSCALRGGLQ